MKTHISHTVTFGREGDAADAQRHGWSGGEDGFTWMIGPESTLIVPPQQAPHGLFVEIRGVPFTASDRLPGQIVTLKANGQPVGSFTAAAIGVWALHVPAAVCDQRSLVLTFEHPMHASPADLGGASDSRQLSLAVKRIRILVAAEAYTSDTQRSSTVALDCMDEQRSQDAIAEVPAHLGIAADELAKQFESLGSNCEFGFFQRRCGIEPLGLFRFSSSTVEDLVRGFDVSFEAVGDPASVRIILEENGSGQWIALEDNYNMRYHTFTHEREADAAQVLRQEVTRLAFYGRKLIDDVMDGRKTFVFKRRSPPLSQPEVLPLFLALNRHARNTLLWVTVADHPDQAGHVVETIPGLLHGYVRRLAPPEMVPDLSVPDWLAVCVNARLLLERASATAR